MRVCPSCGTSFTQNERLCPRDGQVLEDRNPTDRELVGRVLAGKYRVDGHLKSGGMGSVYRGTHVLLHKPVAIKLILPDLLGSPEVVRRFQREAQTASQISHPNVVVIHDLGQAEDGALYIVMELLDGLSLRDFLKTQEGPLNPAIIVDLVEQVCNALAVAHQHGVVHRDLKPANIMLCPDRRGRQIVKLLDFGIAKAFEVDDGGEALTRTGSLLGTPRYMSPEQASGRPVDARSDIYSLGIILYEMLVGEVPFNAPSMIAIINQHLQEPPEPPSHKRPEARIDPVLERIALRCLRKDPQERFASADAVLQELEAWRAADSEKTLGITIGPAVPSTPRTGPMSVEGPPAAAPPIPPPPRRPARWPGAALIGAGLLAVALLVRVLVHNRQADPGPVALAVETDPPGALVEVEGETRAAPATLTLADRRKAYRVAARRPGYVTRELSFDPRLGPPRLKITLTPQCEPDPGTGGTWPARVRLEGMTAQAEARLEQALSRLAVVVGAGCDLDATVRASSGSWTVIDPQGEAHGHGQLRHGEEMVPHVRPILGSLHLARLLLGPPAPPGGGLEVLVSRSSETPGPAPSLRAGEERMTYWVRSARHDRLLLVDLNGLGKLAVVFPPGGAPPGQWHPVLADSPVEPPRGRDLAIVIAYAGDSGLAELQRELQGRQAALFALDGEGGAEDAEPFLLAVARKLSAGGGWSRASYAYRVE